jgi:hypothetical protein
MTLMACSPSTRLASVATARSISGQSGRVRVHLLEQILARLKQARLADRHADPVQRVPRWSIP